MREGLLALCHRKAIPVFVGAPPDGSIFLSSMKLWSDAALGGAPYAFDLDLHAEVFESCALHYWGLKSSEAGALGALVLGARGRGCVVRKDVERARYGAYSSIEDPLV